MRTARQTAPANTEHLLDPENFRVPLVPENGGGEFAQLRARIAELEQIAEQGGATRQGGTAGGDVTAPVTPRAPRRKRNDRSNAMATLQPTTTSGNAPSWNDILAVAKQLGTEAGMGKDTQIKFAMKVIEAAYLGVLDLDPNKHGTDKRDGVVLAQAYVQAQQGAVIFDAKADTGRKLISNLDKCIKLGSNPKWGQGQPLQNVNELMTFRQTEKKAGKKVDDAFNTLMRYATQQLRKETLIADDELKAFVYKRVTGVRTAEDVLDSVRKTLNQLKAGKIAHCPDMDTSNEVAEAVRLMTKRLTAIAKAKGSNAPGGAVSAPAAQSSPHAASA